MATTTRTTTRKATSRTSATPKRTTAKKTTAKKTTATKTTPRPTTTPKVAVPVEPTLTRSDSRTGPVLAGYRLGLKAIESVTVGVGGFSLGSLGDLGLPKSFSNKLKGGHATVMHGASHASDVVGTAVAGVVGRSVSLASDAAKYVFPA